MHRKLMRIGVITFVIVAAFAALGAATALWNPSIFVTGKVNTGTVSAQFTKAFTDDDDVVNDPARDSGDTGLCQDDGGVALPGRTTTSCDPAASGPDPKARLNKDVARCDASITSSTSSQTSGQIVKTNAYPGYFCTAWFQVKNNGTIPLVITDVQLCDSHGCHSAPFGPPALPLDLNGDGVPDVAVDITELHPCQYLARGESLYFDVDQQVLSGVPQGASLTEKVQVTIAPWNSICPPPTPPCTGANCPSPTPVLTPPPTTTPQPTPTPCVVGANCPTPTPCIVTPNCPTPTPPCTSTAICPTPSPTPTATPCDPASNNCPTPTPPCTGATCPTPTPCTAAGCTPTPTPCALAVCNTPTPVPTGPLPSATP